MGYHHNTSFGWNFLCNIFSLTDEFSWNVFVVVSKVIDAECDYDTAVIGSQRIRMAQFEAAFCRIQQ